MIVAVLDEFKQNRKGHISELVKENILEHGIEIYLVQGISGAMYGAPKID